MLLKHRIQFRPFLEQIIWFVLLLSRHASSAQQPSILLGASPSFSRGTALYSSGPILSPTICWKWELASTFMTSSGHSDWSGGGALVQSCVNQFQLETFRKGSKGRGSNPLCREGREAIGSQILAFSKKLAHNKKREQTQRRFTAWAGGWAGRQFFPFLGFGSQS